jgi:hypothetical protein
MTSKANKCKTTGRISLYRTHVWVIASPSSINFNKQASQMSTPGRSLKYNLELDYPWDSCAPLSQKRTNWLMPGQIASLTRSLSSQIPYPGPSNQLRVVEPDPLSVPDPPMRLELPGRRLRLIHLPERTIRANASRRWLHFRLRSVG